MLGLDVIFMPTPAPPVYFSSDSPYTPNRDIRLRLYRPWLREVSAMLGWNLQTICLPVQSWTSAASHRTARPSNIYTVLQLYYRQAL